jgi:4-amino-4-deoxy-L-arabinose transferase-like glycosyltransferase
LRRDRKPLLAVSAVFLCAALLRIWMMTSHRPGFVGWGDTWAYVTAADGHLFFDLLRGSGYPLFLKAAHIFSTELSFTVLVQHGLGLVAGLLLYLTVRRLDAPRWAALLAASGVLFGGTQIFAEHAVLSEALFVFTTCAAIYAGVRALDGGLRWAAAVGAMLAIGGTIRPVGFVLVVPFGLWLLLSTRGRLRQRAIVTAAAVAAAAVVAVSYAAWRDSHIGGPGASSTVGFGLYGRVATFADCDEFDPPPGSEVLCEPRAPSERPGPKFYVWNLESPARKAFGTPQSSPGGSADVPTEAEMDLITAFAREAVLNQPFDYLKSALVELARFVAPNFEAEAWTGSTPDQWRDAIQREGAQSTIDAYYSTRGFYVHRGRFDVALAYEKATRLSGVPMAVVLLLAVVSPFVTRGHQRRGAALFVVIAATLILVPAATFFYDYRYAIPTFGPLIAAAALGVFGMQQRVRAARAAQG